MPTTTTGTPYTVTAVTVTGHGTARWGVADAVAGTSNIPAILYAHGAGGDSTQFATLAAWKGLRDWLIDNGWAWVEGSGGATQGAQNWGNPAAQEAYPAYLARAEETLDIGEVVLLGRSMGGLVTAWLYAQWSGRARFSGWINNSGVTAILTGNGDSGAPSAERNSLRYFGATMWDAYGQTDYGAAVSAVQAAGTAPELWPASVWDAKSILCCYGDADTTVPFYPRGAEPVRTLWAGHPAIDQVSLRPGGDHGQTNGSYLDVDTMSAFLLDAVGVVPPPPSPPRVLRHLASYYLIGGQLEPAGEPRPHP